MALHSNEASELKGKTVSTQTVFSRQSLSDILSLSQSDDPHADAARNQLVNAFGNKLKEITASTCRRYYLQSQEQEDALGEAYLQLFDPNIVRFNALRGKPENYLQGIVQNAARKIMAQLGLRNRKAENDDIRGSTQDSHKTKGFRTPLEPLSPAEEAEIHDSVTFILDQATPRVRKVLELLYWYDWPLRSIAKHLRVSRFALARELRAFFEKMRLRRGSD